MRKRRGKRVIGAVFLVIGIILFMLPDIRTFLFDQENDEVISEFKEEYDTEETEGEEEGAELSSASVEYDDFYYECLAYNENLVETSQSELVDPFSVTGIPTGLSAESDVFGYITIPAMDLEMPLYIGAELSNLAKGAAILSQTSMPIGGDTGVSSNCVIAGHRGYQGIPYFREIEKLSVGDYVYITNRWETLAYQVTSIAIINPNDVDSILIQDGRDMVTLMTCHPYRSHGKYRYIVYCDRVDTIDGVAVEAGGDTPFYNDTPEEYEASQDEIDMEKYVRMVGAVVILACLIYLVIPGRKQKNYY